MASTGSNVASTILAAQDDNDTVLLPNACSGQLIKLSDDTTVRCFSILAREPHLIPQSSWSMITTPTMLPGVTDMVVCLDKIMVDHVTRGVIGDSALQIIASENGDVEAIRLLPPDGGSAQKYWGAQAKLRLNI